METLAETFTEQLTLPPFHGSTIFNVSVDIPPQNGGTEEERATRENQNVNRAQRQANKITLAIAEQQLDSQGRPLQHNLDDEFVRVDGHDIYKTPSANLPVAANELAWLPQTSKVTKVIAMLKVVHCQVNEIHQDQRPSYSTSLIRRSATPRPDRHPSHFTN